ncbi:MAG: hypothetical protein QGI13_07870 [Rhodospirillales bacterium]|jgi:hypothetical protein|nr:hypothetical protein [Rhodospirillales bacterium]
MSVQPAFAPAALSEATCFSVHAPADPSVMPRVMDVFAKRSLVPSRWHSTLDGPGGEELHIDIQVAGLEPAAGERLAALLRQLVCVETMLTSHR